jgi:hypothetical protein
LRDNLPRVFGSESLPSFPYYVFGINTSEEPFLFAVPFADPKAKADGPALLPGVSFFFFLSDVGNPFEVGFLPFEDFPF